MQVVVDIPCTGYNSKATGAHAKGSHKQRNGVQLGLWLMLRWMLRSSKEKTKIHAGRFRPLGTRGRGQLRGYILPFVYAKLYFACLATSALAPSP